MEKANVMLFDDTQRHLFRKMLEMRVDFIVSKKIMSFWMFLESKGFKNIFQNLLVIKGKFFLSICAEAEIVLAFLELQSNLIKTAPYISCPNTWKFAPSDLSPRDVLGNKEEVFNAILGFQMAFEDILDKKDKSVNSLYPNVEKAGSDEGSLIIKKKIEGFKLNPFAVEWIPGPVPEENRSLFMTFSKGRPLSKAEIIQHFQRMHGINCLESVYIHTPKNRLPEFGKITFKYSWIPNWMLHDKDSVIINIDGERTIGLKKYKLL